MRRDRPPPPPHVLPHHSVVSDASATQPCADKPEKYKDYLICAYHVLKVLVKAVAPVQIMHFYAGCLVRPVL